MIIDNDSDYNVDIARILKPQTLYTETSLHGFGKEFQLIYEFDGGHHRETIVIYAYGDAENRRFFFRSHR